MDRYVDLHVHTTCSDGRLSPAEAVAAAAERGLAAIAITDHDVLDGIEAAIAAGRRLGVEVVPGIELTTTWSGRTAHLLGYFIDPASAPLRHALARARRLATDHVAALLDRLAHLGHRLELADLRRYRTRYESAAGLVLAMAERGLLRLPEARELLRLASQEPRAFDAVGAIDLIHQAGGIASLAHPARLNRRKPLLEEHDLAPLVEAGLDAIEVWQVIHDGAARQHYASVAASLGLLATGGSDCHGPRRGLLRLGSQRVPAEVLTRLREAHARAAPAQR